MRNHHGSLILAACLGTATLAVAAESSRPASNADPIEKLITQLGSARFKEREAAAQALDAAGPAALRALERAARGNDPEICRRAESLVHDIEKRLESAELLKPKRVHLLYQDTPLREALADFSRQCGFALNLHGADSRRITLDTGEVSFWEALDQFCGKAGLVEQAPPSPPANGQEVVRVWNGNGGRQVLMVHSSSQVSTEANFDGPLHLQADKPRVLPTFYAGAVRIRALTNGNHASVPSGETQIHLQVLPQPLMGWQSLVDVRVDKAIDEHGQVLAPALTTNSTTHTEMLQRAGNRAMFFDASTGRPVYDTREIPVRLKTADQPSKMVKELKGAITAQVQTPLQPVITVDDILKAKGKTFRGRDGESLKISDVAEDADGNLKLRILLEEPMQGNLAMNRRMIIRANRPVVRNGVVMRGGIMRETGNPGESKLVLLDSKGRNLSLEMTASGTALNGTAIVQDMQMTFRPRSDASVPRKFVYSNRRLVNVEVPFTLKDVPLP